MDPNDTEPETPEVDRHAQSVANRPKTRNIHRWTSKLRYAITIPSCFLHPHVGDGLPTSSLPTKEQKLARLGCASPVGGIVQICRNLCTCSNQFVIALRTEKLINCRRRRFDSNLVLRSGVLSEEWNRSPPSNRGGCEKGHQLYVHWRRCDSSTCQICQENHRGKGGR